MSNIKTPIPSKIILHKKSRTLEIEFENESCIIPCAYLRAHSLSAEVRHEKDKKSPDDFLHVNILSIEPVGQYAIKPIFSDGHRTGIYSWETLYELGMKYKKENFS